jgi:holin-like protein
VIEAILIIFACQLAGEAMARGLFLPLPGPVIGMALLFAGLQLRSWRWPDSPAVSSLPVGLAAGFLLAHLSLLFVPAGAGIVSHLPVLSAHGIGLVVALVLSTALSLTVTALTFAALAKRFGGQGEP